MPGLGEIAVLIPLEVRDVIAAAEQGVEAVVIEYRHASGFTRSMTCW